jgi:hypothetical protein
VPPKAGSTYRRMAWALSVLRVPQSAVPVSAIWHIGSHGPWPACSLSP